MQYRTAVLRAAELPSQSWWKQLHATILESFQSKNFSVFPPTWSRLDPQPEKGAQGLVNELGERGHIMVVFTSDGLPVACSGVLPFRGEHWINDVQEKGDAEVANGEITRTGDLPSGGEIPLIQDWETCCFCVLPCHRGQGLARMLSEQLIAFIQPKGARRLVSNYAVEETGDFWPRLGFVEIPGAGGMLPKGFQTDPNKEGLRADVYFRMAAKRL